MTSNPTPILRLRRLCTLLGTVVLTLLVLVAHPANAESLNFDTSSDLSGFLLQGSTGSPLQWGGTFGTGSPAAGGGLRFLSASSSRVTTVATKEVTATASTVGQWQMSLMVNPAGVFASAETETKVEYSFGFTNSTTGSGNWEKFLTERTNASAIGVIFKVEKKNTKVEINGFNLSNGSKADLPKQSWSAPSFSMNQWFRVTLHVIRTGTSTFSHWYTLEEMGTTGTTPNLVQTTAATPSTITNTFMASAQVAYSGMVVSSDKGGLSAYVDNYTTDLSTPNPPAVPEAQEPTVVASSSFTASWVPGAGLPPAGYLLEVSTLADNFAANKLISATGATGQATGIVLDAAANTQVISGLLPATAYVYRVKGTNSAGSSAASSPINVTTLSMGANSPPTLNELADFGPISSVTAPQIVNLSGISPGAESAQTVTVTASSSNPAVISASVTYSSPAATGTLTLAPGGQQGTAVITVTVDDGQVNNNTLSRTFSALVSNPPENLAFDTEDDVARLATVTAPTLSFSRGATAGAGEPPGGGLVVTSSSVTASDAGFAAWRAQSYPLAGITSLETSILVNMRELDDMTIGEGKAEFRIGFTPTLSTNAAKLHEFLHKSNKAVSVNLKAEHKPSDSGKNRVLEAQMFFNADEVKAGTSSVSGTDAVNNWLKITFKVIPMGGGMFGASYKIEDLGEFGTDTPAAPLLKSDMVTFSAPTLAASPVVYAAYAGKIEKQLTHLYLDDHRVILSNNAPDVPTALPASLVTSNKFTARWAPGVSVYPTGYLLEVVQGAATPFAAGNFLAANGTAGQAAGMAISGGGVLKQAMTGLAPGTTYRYRVTATNINGSSPPSPDVTVTTLATGQNAVPTLDPITNPPPLAMNAGQQFVRLTGITDGGEDGQPVTLTATSGSPSVIPQESLSFTYDAGVTTSGVLAFTPAAGQTGTVTITVTVNDGQATNASVSQSLTVKVVNPPPMLEFPTSSELEELIITQANLNLTHEVEGGVGTPGTGGLLFSGGTQGTDRDVVVVRPTAYNAQQASYLYSTMMVNFAEVLNAPVGSKDKGELRLGFMNSSTPYAAKPKETMHKANPSLGVKFKLEHDTSDDEDKDRKIEVELFAYDGNSELKAGKVELNGFANANHWFKVSFYAVRSGTGSYYLTSIVDDYGVDGTLFMERVVDIPPSAFVNTAFATDNTVFSAFVLGGEKAGTGSLRADKFEAVVNTTAPDAPATQVATDVTYESFTANWSPAVTGHQDLAGFVVEICDPEDLFGENSFYAADGTPGHATGIYVED
ncbi:MAG TPA: fibronectin type III domain-containing protein, partial [Verrucomicrobium sp.]|nr:fibronectin type III domain-containing protein [Verrucomicrobium sp.]